MYVYGFKGDDIFIFFEFNQKNFVIKATQFHFILGYAYGGISLESHYCHFKDICVKILTDGERTAATNDGLPWLRNVLVTEL